MTLEGIEDLLDLAEEAMEDSPRLNGHVPEALFVMGSDGAGRIIIRAPGCRPMALAKWKSHSAQGRELALTALLVQLEAEHG